MNMGLVQVFQWQYLQIKIWDYITNILKNTIKSKVKGKLKDKVIDALGAADAAEVLGALKAYRLIPPSLYAAKYNQQVVQIETVTAKYRATLKYLQWHLVAGPDGCIPKDGVVYPPKTVYGIDSVTADANGGSANLYSDTGVNDIHIATESAMSNAWNNLNANIESKKNDISTQLCP